MSVMNARRALKALRKEMDQLATAILARIGQDAELQDLFIKLDEMKDREERLVGLALTELAMGGQK